MHVAKALSSIFYTTYMTGRGFESSGNLGATGRGSESSRNLGATGRGSESSRNLGATGRKFELSRNLGVTGGVPLTARNLGSADRDVLPESEVSVHCNSGIDTKRGDICGMISLWRGAAVTQDIATVIGGREDFRPDRNVSVSFDQSTAGFMLRSQGRPRTIGADGWS